MLAYDCRTPVLLRGGNADTNLSRLAVVYLIGKFFNNFLPGMVGGDVARSVLIGRKIGSQTQSAASIFLERFTGFLTLLLLTACALTIQSSLRSHVIVIAFVAATLALCTLVIVLIYRPVLQQRLSRLLSKIPILGKSVPFADRLYHEVAFFSAHYRLLLQVLGLSVLFYLLGGLNLFLAARAIDAPIKLYEIMLTTPLIYLATTVPVSPGNIGWWEWSVALLLQPAGLLVAQGLAIGVLIHAVTFGVSLVGGLLFIVVRYRANAGSI